MAHDRKSLSRLELLGLARSMINDRGLANFSLRGLARKRGCSAPSLYEYFRSLDEILKELREREERQLCAVLEQVKASNDTAVEAAANMIRAYIQHFDGQSGRFEIFFDTFKTSRPTIDASLPQGSSYQLLLDVMNRLGAELDCKKDRSEQWAFTAWSYAHGVCVLRANFLAPLASEIEPLIESGVEVFMGGIVADAERLQ